MSNYLDELELQQLESIRLWAKYWSDHDSTRLLEVFIEDLVYEDVPTPRVNLGAAQLVSFSEEVFHMSSDVEYEITDAFVSLNRGGAEWVMRGTHQEAMAGLPATGKKFEVRGSSVFEFEGHKIRRCSDYWCMATLFHQLTAATE